MTRRSCTAILAGGLACLISSFGYRQARVPLRVVPRKGYIHPSHCFVIRADTGEDMGNIPLALNPPLPWSPGQEFDLVRWASPRRRIWGRSGFVELPPIPVVVVA